MAGLVPCLGLAVVAVLRGYVLADAVRAVAVDEVQRRRSQLVEVIHHNVPEPGLAAEVLVREDTAHRKDLQECAEVGCCGVGNYRDGHTDHQQPEVHMAQPASLQAQHQQVHRYAWHMRMPLDRQSALSTVPQGFVPHSK